MAIKHVRSGEVDTPEEVAKAINRLIDNMNQMEAKIEQLVSEKKTKTSKKGAKNEK